MPRGQGFHSVTQVDLVLLPQPPKWWDYRCAAPHLANNSEFLINSESHAEMPMKLGGSTGKISNQAVRGHMTVSRGKATLAEQSWRCELRDLAADPVPQPSPDLQLLLTSY